MNNSQNTIQVVLVDINDNLLGYKEKYQAHKIPIPLHRAISVLIYNESNRKMLIQKRSSNKPTWPGYWSNATCTHPFPGEAYRKAAERRLFEEMGIKVPLREVGRIIYKAKYNKTWGEHEYDIVFTGNCNGSVRPDPLEVNDYKWMNVSDLKKDIIDNSRHYTPWFKIILSSIH